MNKGKKKNNLKFLSKFIKKLDIRKKIIPILLSGTVLAGTGVGGYILGKHSNDDKSNSNSNSNFYSDENNEGFDSIGVFGTGKVKKDNFVILDIGDHNNVETSFQNKKMKLCNNNDISLGVIISSDAENECDIYNDVDYVKSIVRDYKIDFPVYLDIDNIINNSKINTEMKVKLINDFLVKCTDNGMYVGISGKDNNLCKLSEIFDTSLYDAYVVMDKDTISYDGVYNVYKDLDGKLHSNSNLAEVITTCDFNTKNKFLADGQFVVKGYDDLKNISLKYGMSTKDILNFNNMKKSSLKKGKIIRVPNVENGVVNYPNSGKKNNYDRVDDYLIGCDMSFYQGLSCNWSQLKNNFDFIILKSSQGLNIDSCFESNAASCEEYNIPMGIYVFNDYWNDGSELSTFKNNQQKQAEYALSLLKDKKVEYPVYLDIEKVGFNGIIDLPEDYANAMLDIWYNTISRKGYIPGIYLNQSLAEYLESVTSYKLSDKFEVWIAGGPQYEVIDENGYVKFDIDDMIPPQFFEDGNYGVNMCQPGLVYGTGAGNGEGFLDFDFCKVDYANTKNKDNTSDSDIEFDDDIKSFRRVNGFAPISCIALSGLGIAGFGIRNYKKKKEEEKKSKIKTRQKK